MCRRLRRVTRERLIDVEVMVAGMACRGHGRKKFGVPAVKTTGQTSHRPLVALACSSL